MTKRNTKRQTTAKVPKAAPGRKSVRQAPVAPQESKSTNGEKKATHEPAAVAPPSRATSKQSKVIAALREPSGVTIDSMMKMTGWQQHSVRGFLAGVVRKKLDLNLVSEDGKKNGRIYRINSSTPRSEASVPTTAA